MKRNKKLENRRKNIPNDVDIFVSNSFQIVDRIFEILEKKELEQKDLAKLLNKSESEISKWMTGTHNFTLRTLSKIKDVLKEDIIIIPKLSQFSSCVDLSYSGYNITNPSLEQTTENLFISPSLQDLNKLNIAYS